MSSSTYLSLNLTDLNQTLTIFIYFKDTKMSMQDQGGAEGE